MHISQLFHYIYLSSLRFTQKIVCNITIYFDISSLDLSISLSLSRLYLVFLLWICLGTSWSWISNTEHIIDYITSHVISTTNIRMIINRVWKAFFHELKGYVLGKIKLTTLRRLPFKSNALLYSRFFPVIYIYCWYIKSYQ